MTLKDDLTALAERGTPRGALEVYEAASDEAAARIALSSIKERAGTAPRGRGRGWVAAAAAAAAALVAVATLGGVLYLGDREEPTSVASDGGDAAGISADVQAPQPSTDVRPEDIKGMEAVTNADVTRIGYVREDRDAPVDDEIPEPAPVYDKDGNQIAWWGYPLGWIDLETMADPSYDFEAEYREYLAIGEQIERSRTTLPSEPTG